MPSSTHLTAGIEALTTSEAWQAHLDVQGRFHRYSFSNALLISAQDPGATRVAGFATWKKLGRSVRKGRAGDLDPRPDDRATRTRERTARSADPSSGSAPVAVFDVAQTDGEPLPVVCRNLHGGDPSLGLRPAGGARRCSGLCGGVGPNCPVSTNGDCAFALRRIRVECRNEPAQQVKTLAHELAHALLHEGIDDRPLAELEAESTAYVVCRSLGLDTAGLLVRVRGLLGRRRSRGGGPDQGVGREDPAGGLGDPRRPGGGRRTLRPVWPP